MPGHSAQGTDRSARAAHRRTGRLAGRAAEKGGDVRPASWAVPSPAQRTCPARIAARSLPIAQGELQVTKSGTIVDIGIILSLTRLTAPVVSLIIGVLVLASPVGRPVYAAAVQAIRGVLAVPGGQWHSPGIVNACGKLEQELNALCDRLAAIPEEM